MECFFKIKIGYLKLIEKDKRTALETVAYGLLIILSLVYGLAAAVRNFIYDIGLIKAYVPKGQLISIGNLSWAGSGKTPLSIWLYERLSPVIKTCVVRRGYGDDENKLLQELIGTVFFSPNRCSLIKNKQDFYDLFILDDGFQYRRLAPTVSIVIMGAREFRTVYRLIPASYFREPFSNLRRADMVVINHSNELLDRKEISEKIMAVAPHLPIYFADYIMKCFKGLDGRVYTENFLSDKPIAAFAAIGYPEGFFKKLKGLGFDLRYQVAYPDHHQLSVEEFLRLEDKLLREEIYYLVITHKDKYHFPYQSKKLKIIVAEIDFSFEDESRFLTDIKKRLALTR